MSLAIVQAERLITQWPRQQTEEKIQALLRFLR